MIDQYGNVAPNDLVLLPVGQYLTEEAWDVVISMPWYEILGGILLMSAKDLPSGVEGDDPADAGITMRGGYVRVVQPVLHRYTEADGFYHA